MSHGTGVRQKSSNRKGQGMPTVRVVVSQWQVYAAAEGHR